MKRKILNIIKFHVTYADERTNFLIVHRIELLLVCIYTNHMKGKKYV